MNLSKLKLDKFLRNCEVQKVLDNSVLKGRIGWQGLTTAEYR